MIEILVIVIAVLTLVSVGLLFSIKMKSDSTEQSDDNFDSINQNITKFDGYLEKSLKSITEQLQQNRSDSNAVAKDNRDELKESLKDLKKSIDDRLKSIQEDSTKQLDKMRDTVDQKLQETLEKKTCNLLLVYQLNQGLPVGFVQQIRYHSGFLDNRRQNPMNNKF